MRFGDFLRSKSTFFAFRSARAGRLRSHPSPGRVRMSILAALFLALGGSQSVFAEQVLKPGLGPIEEVQAPRSGAAVQPENAGQPHWLRLQDGELALGWLERDVKGDVSWHLSRWKSNGWTPARELARSPKLLMNWADRPVLQSLENDQLVGAALLENPGGHHAYDLGLYQGVSNADSLQGPVLAHQDGKAVEHGFPSLFSLEHGRVGVVWLDGRAYADAQGAGHGGMTGHSELRFRSLDSTTGELSEETVVDQRVCDCCPTAVTAIPEGYLVAYRDRSPEEIRDIYTARYVNGKWEEPSRVHPDNWKIPGCPVNGPDLASNGESTAIAWFTLQGEERVVWAAFSLDAGKTWSTPSRIDQGEPVGRVDIELFSDGTALVGWLESQEKGSAFLVRRIAPSGKRSEAVEVAKLHSGRSSGHPRMAVRGDQVFFAWVHTMPGEGKRPLTSLKTAVAPLD